MNSIADVRTAVLLRVYDDRDRSVERTVQLAIDAGIAHERERIASILKMSAPPGLEKALLLYALHPSTTAESAAEFISTFPAADHSAKLRKGFRLVSDNSEQI